MLLALLLLLLLLLVVMVVMMSIADDDLTLASGEGFGEILHHQQPVLARNRQRGL